MKKIILIAGLLLYGLTQAQDITLTGNGETVTNGQTFTFSTLDAATATLDLVVTNNSENTINIKMKVKGITNADGSEVQFCLEQCFFNISVGSKVPSIPQEGIAVEAGASTLGDNHFYNNNAGIDQNMPVSYELAIITVDTEGNEVNELIAFNYVYDATASISDFEALQNAGITLKSTILKNNIEVDAQQNASLELYNSNGQLIKSAKISSGNQLIDVSSLSNAVYIARFTTEDNKISQIRVVKQ